MARKDDFPEIRTLGAHLPKSLTFRISIIYDPLDSEKKAVEQFVIFLRKQHNSCAFRLISVTVP